MLACDALLHKSLFNLLLDISCSFASVTHCHSFGL